MFAWRPRRADHAALASLGTTPTDIVVSFKAVVRCSSTNAIDKKEITVQVAQGDGTVEAQPI